MNGVDDLKTRPMTDKEREWLDWYEKQPVETRDKFSEYVENIALRQAAGERENLGETTTLDDFKPDRLYNPVNIAAVVVYDHDNQYVEAHVGEFVGETPEYYVIRHFDDCSYERSSWSGDQHEVNIIEKRGKVLVYHRQVTLAKPDLEKKTWLEEKMKQPNFIVTAIDALDHYTGDKELPQVFVVRFYGQLMGESDNFVVLRFFDSVTHDPHYHHVMKNAILFRGDVDVEDAVDDHDD